MNIFRPYKNQKTRAQAIVEFALVLPILLILIYGLLETGRLLFIYASTITAARQAARYGSATGDNPSGTPYYNDCDGIEAAARKVGFINIFDSVTTSYDDYDVDLKKWDPIPLTDPACENFTPTGNGNRIIVEVTTQWSPIVPIVPLKPMLIRSTSERTILTSVDIYVPADPPDFNPAGDGKPFLIEVIPDQSTYNAVNQVIHYTYNLQNTGLGNLVSPTIVDDKITVNCGAITVAPGATFSCTGEYYITQADLDAGSFVNKAYPTGWQSNLITTVITATQLPSINLAKSGSPEETSQVGTTVTYTYTITNTGNVMLNAPFSVTDNQIPVSCSGAKDIAPGSSTTCSGTDQVTDQDVKRGSMVNQATASVSFKTTTVTSNMATFSVLTSPIVLRVTPPPSIITPGDKTYTFTLKNTTDYIATGLVISDTKVILDPSCPKSIPAHSAINCTGIYTVTQANIDAGLSIESSTVATATLNSESISSNQYVSLVQITRTPALTPSLVTTLSANPLVAGSTILYIYTLTNSGNVTLKSPISVTDSKAIIITCPDQSDFAPTLTRTCTGTYSVLAADLAGAITTTGTASAKFSDGIAPDPDTIQATPITMTTATFDGPRFSIEAKQDKTIVTPDNLTLKYTYTLTNTGSVPLSRPYTVTFTLQTTLLIANTGGTDTTTTINLDSYLNCIKDSIAPGESTECTYTYSHPSGTGSSTILNTLTTAKIGTTNATSLPALPPAMVYNCTPTNFVVTKAQGSTKWEITNPVEWVITNNTGTLLPISKISITWANSGPAGGNNYQLQDVTLNSVSLSTLTTTVLPDSSSPYSSGSFNITTGQSTLYFLFSKTNPPATINTFNVTTGSPYGACSRSWTP